MDFLKNFNLAGMEFQYALGLVGLFLMVILLFTGIHYGLAEPIRKRRLINQRLRGNKREQVVRAQVFKAFQETKESVILNLAERYFGWGKVDNLQIQLLQADIFLSPHMFICIAILMAGSGFMIGWLMGSWTWSLGLSFLLGITAPHGPAVEAEAEDPEDRALHARRHGVAGQVSEGRPHLVRNPGPGESGDPGSPRDRDADNVR